MLCTSRPPYHRPHCCHLHRVSPVTLVLGCDHLLLREHLVLLVLLCLEPSIRATALCSACWPIRATAGQSEPLQANQSHCRLSRPMARCLEMFVFKWNLWRLYLGRLPRGGEMFCWVPPLIEVTALISSWQSCLIPTASYQRFQLITFLSPLSILSPCFCSSCSFSDGNGGNEAGAALGVRRSTARRKICCTRSVAAKPMLTLPSCE